MVGLPLSLDGSIGPAADRVLAEGDELAEVLDVPVETCTTSGSPPSPPTGRCWSEETSTARPAARSSTRSPPPSSCRPGSTTARARPRGGAVVTTTTEARDHDPPTIWSDQPRRHATPSAPPTHPLEPARRPAADGRRRRAIAAPATPRRPATPAGRRRRVLRPAAREPRPALARRRSSCVLAVVRRRRRRGCGGTEPGRPARASPARRSPSQIPRGLDHQRRRRRSSTRRASSRNATIFSFYVGGKDLGRSRPASTRSGELVLRRGASRCSTPVRHPPPPRPPRSAIPEGLTVTEIVGPRSRAVPAARPSRTSQAALDERRGRPATLQPDGPAVARGPAVPGHLRGRRRRRPRSTSSTVMAAEMETRLERLGIDERPGRHLEHAAGSTSRLRDPHHRPR